MGTKIEWCDETINPLGWGCYGPEGTPENPKRCSYCYAYRMAKRNLRDCQECREFVPHWHPEQLELLETWKKPRRIFMQSMGDLLHPAVPFINVHEVWDAMKAHERHTFLVLTKRPDHGEKVIKRIYSLQRFGWAVGFWKHVWVGTTVEGPGQEWRIEKLLQIPASVRFVSMEPMLGPVDLRHIQTDSDNKINWVIIGAQTGPGAIKPKLEWIQSVVDQCRAAGVPVFLKNNLWDIWPGKLIQEFPEVA